MSTRRTWQAAVVLTLVIPLAVVAAVAASVQAPAAEVPVERVPTEVMQWAFLAAALVTSVSALGAAYAVAVVGGAAVGAIAEKPETAGRAIIFVGLAEGIAIYGLIIAIMILGYLP